MGLKESLIERVSGGEYKKKDDIDESIPSEDEDNYSDGLDLSSALESPVNSDGFSLESLVDDSNYDDDGLEVNQDFNPLMQAANEAKHESSSFEYNTSNNQVSIDQVYQQQIGQSFPSNINDRYQQQEAFGFDSQQVDYQSQYQQNNQDSFHQYNSFDSQHQDYQPMYDQQHQQQNNFYDQQQYAQVANQQQIHDYQQQNQQYSQPQQYGMQYYASQVNQVIPEPAPAVYGMNDSPNIYSADSSINDILEENLLSLAKRVVLEDIVSTFESALITKDALSKLIDSYLNNSQSPYTNGKAVLTSVIDEILDSDYKQDHYGELVPMILSSVKADLN